MGHPNPNRSRLPLQVKHLVNAVEGRDFSELLRQVIVQIDKSGMNVLVACEQGDYSSAVLIAALLMCTGEPVERERILTLPPPPRPPPRSLGNRGACGPRPTR